MKSPLGLAALVLVALLAPAGRASAETSREAALIAQGQTIAQTHCKRCHAIGRTGESPNVQAPLFRRLAARYPLDHLAEAFAEGIVVSHTKMPRFEFEPLQIEALLAYLDSLSKRSASRP
jgi:mono/diheme cytochrome c family protein